MKHTAYQHNPSAASQRRYLLQHSSGATVTAIAFLYHHHYYNHSDRRDNFSIAAVAHQSKLYQRSSLFLTTPREQRHATQRKRRQNF